jgi:hypothetical protein
MSPEREVPVLNDTNFYWWSMHAYALLLVKGLGSTLPPYAEWRAAQAARARASAAAAGSGGGAAGGAAAQPHAGGVTHPAAAAPPAAMLGTPLENQRAIGYMFFSVADRYKELVISSPTANEAWQRLYRAVVLEGHITPLCDDGPRPAAGARGRRPNRGGRKRT